MEIPEFVDPRKLDLLHELSHMEDMPASRALYRLGDRDDSNQAHRFLGELVDEGFIDYFSRPDGSWHWDYCKITKKGVSEILPAPQMHKLSN